MFAVLALQGSFLSSVELSEITVTVGGEPCPEKQPPADDINTVSSLQLHSKNGFVVITTMYVKCSADSQELGYTS